MAETPMHPLSPSVSRRTIARGVAWLAPAITLTAAAPAFAASGPPPVLAPAGQCKLPGARCNPLVKGYLFKVTLTNTSTLPIWIYTGGTYGPLLTDNDPDITLTYEKGKVGTTIYNPGEHIPVPAGETVTLLINAGENTNSANLAVLITLSLSWGHTPNPANDTKHVDDPVVATIDVDSTPPCVDCTL